MTVADTDMLIIYSIVAASAIVSAFFAYMMYRTNKNYYDRRLALELARSQNQLDAANRQISVEKKRADDSKQYAEDRIKVELAKLQVERDKLDAEHQKIRIEKAKLKERGIDLNGDK